MASLTADDQPRIWIQKNYASFNGIRGLAVLLVFGSHFLWIAPFYQLVYLQNFGFLGVELFFVLSGFLITGILYDVMDEPNYFRHFYIRRSLRIFPLFYGLYLVMAVLSPFLHLRFVGHVPAFLLYVGNLLPPFIHEGMGRLNSVRIPIHGHWYTAASMGHFWSLCVEEQFYLLWPAVVLWVRSRVTLMRVCVLGMVVALAIRITLRTVFPQLATDTDFIYDATYTRFDTLLVGAFLALYLRGNTLTRAQLHRASWWLIALPGALAFCGGMVHFSIWNFQGSPFTQTIGFTLIALASAGVLLQSLDDTGRLSRFFRSRALARLGIVSYGFYVIHGLPGVLLHELDEPIHDWLHAQHALRAGIFFGWLLLAWLLAECSFRLYEQPFLRLKNKLAPERKLIHIDK